SEPVSKYLFSRREACLHHLPSCRGVSHCSELSTHSTAAGRPRRASSCPSLCDSQSSPHKEVEGREVGVRRYKCGHHQPASPLRTKQSILKSLKSREDKPTPSAQHE
uniref:Uncharacterized protein n=1 Tax=Cairina moschata TaxID=8855 RepID=A0A8C3BUV5_CAIMO